MADRDVDGLAQELLTRPPADLLCRRCDVFVGFGAVGTVRQPEGRSLLWLANHCWICGRDAEEIAAFPR